MGEETNVFCQNFSISLSRFNIARPSQTAPCHVPSDAEGNLSLFYFLYRTNPDEISIFSVSPVDKSGLNSSKTDIFRDLLSGPSRDVLFLADVPACITPVSF
jgi:hypothetical protein